MSATKASKVRRAFSTNCLASWASSATAGLGTVTSTVSPSRQTITVPRKAHAQPVFLAWSMVAFFPCTAGFPASSIYARPPAYHQGNAVPVPSDGRKVVDEGRNVHGGRSDATERLHVCAPVCVRSGKGKRTKRPTGLGPFGLRAEDPSDYPWAAIIFADHSGRRAFRNEHMPHHDARKATSPLVMGWFAGSLWVFGSDR